MAKKTGAKLKTRANRDDRRDDERDVNDREVTEDRVMTDEARLSEFRQSLHQSVLPDLPKIKGYHVCWLTTQNPADPIQARIRLGYEPVLARDVPGWEMLSLRTGDYPGAIGINEMIAFKIPVHLYEMYMREVHHTRPNHEEGRLSSVVDVIREEAAQAAESGDKGFKVEVEPGTAGLGKKQGPSPNFSKLAGDI